MEVFILAILFIQGCICGKSKEQELINHLLKEYSKQARPVIDYHDAVNATFGLEVIQLVAVGDRDQFMQIKAWVRQSWMNMHFKWDADDWGGIGSVQIESELLWVPDIVLYNNAESDFSGETEKYKTRVRIFSSGLCQWLAPAMFKSTCSINIRYFPFDEQYCSMTFGSWTYSKKGIALSKTNENVIGSNYINSSEWNIIKINKIQTEIKYDCCDYPFVDVTFDFTLKRKPLYYVFNIILPCIILVATVLFGFFLPPESGERISLTITNLLAVAVFLQLVSDTLPRNSDNIPMLAMFYMIIMAESAFSLVTTCIVLTFHFKSVEKGAAPMPKWVQHYILGKLAKFLCIPRTNIYNETNKLLTTDCGSTTSFDNDEYLNENGSIIRVKSANSNNRVIDLRRKSDSQLIDATTLMLYEMKKITESIRSHSDNIKTQEDWRFVAKVLDRLFFWFFLVTVLVSTGAILLPAYLVHN